MPRLGEDIVTTSAVPSREAQSSPRALLVDWANEHDGWARLIAAEVLATGQQLSESAVAEIYDAYKAEKGLSENDLSPSPKLEIDEADGNGDSVLLMLSIDQVEGVNALEGGHAITFNEHLTLLFGENGAGKTGYSRILKRAAKVRTAEPILPNAHAVGQQPTPSARIRYSLAGQESETTWRNEEGLSPFSRLSVFDWLSVTVHLDDELGYLYTPADLALFKHVSDGIEGIQDLLRNETERLRPKPNPFVRLFKRGTRIYPQIESLGPATDLDALAKESAMTRKQESRAEQLKEEVLALKGQTLDDQIFATAERVRLLRLLADAATRASEFDATAYERARDAHGAARQEHASARTELFDVVDATGPADDEWQQFIAAAEAFLVHRGLDDYPSDDDRCIYCHQLLSSEASDLIGRYRSFLDDSLAQQLSSTERHLREQALSLDGLNMAGVSQFLVLLGDQRNPPDWLDRARRVCRQLQSVAEKCASGSAAGGKRLRADASRLLETVSSELDAAVESEAKLRAKKDDRTATLAANEDELAELEARIDLARHLTAIIEYVDEAKRYQRFQTYGKTISTVRRSLTEVAKTASQDLVNSTFKELFTEECAELRAPSVELRFQGRSGKAERRKTVATTYRPSDILSEGEQKVLALADFLAECRMRGTRAPIVFDDPVTSLDYRRLKEVAGRIAALAETHQAVVFTHNIWFTTELLALFEKRKDEITYYAVRDRDDAKGIIASGEGPRRDTPRTIGKRIYKVITAAKKAEPTAKDALIEKGYDLLRSWIETFVEQELLGGVTERYRPNVMMGRLNNLRPDLFTDAIDRINPLFDKACRYMGGHSQPLEQLSVRPSVEDLEQDWTELQELRRAFT